MMPRTSGIAPPARGSPPPTKAAEFVEINNIITTLVRVFYVAMQIVCHVVEAIVLKFVPSKWRTKSVADEVVLITGAGSGLGRLLALKFADLGAKIVCWDINKDAIEETCSDIRNAGGRADAFVCDVSDRRAVYATAARVRATVGRVSLVVNNAGVVSGRRLVDTSDEDIERTFAINALAHYWVVKAFLADMLSSNHGHIVCIASLAGHQGLNRLTDYCGSKFAAVGFADALAVELERDGYTGVHVTTVCPYFIDTGMFSGVTGGAFQILDPNRTADEIVLGVLLNRDVVVLPPLMRLLVAFKLWLPGKVIRLMCRELKLTRCMETFDPTTRIKELH